MQLHGIGPTGAARLLSDVGDIRRFADRDRFASRNSTAPLDASSNDEKRHRLSLAGNRRINRTLHIMAVVQLRNRTQGRTYYDARKSAGKTPMESHALPGTTTVQRRVRRHGRGPEGTTGGRPGRALGDALQSSVTDLTPDIGSSNKPLPGHTHPRTALASVS